MRKEFSKKTKLERFKFCGGKCEACDVKLTPATGIEYDHDKPAAFQGDNSFSNCRCYCRNCHGTKTGKEDIPAIAKSNRTRAKYVGIKRHSSRPIPGSKASGVRKRMNGRVEKW